MEFTMEIKDGIDFTIEEKNNSYTVLRKVLWNGKGEPKLEIRNCFVDKDGGEKLGKGGHFITEDGPTELIKLLIKHDLCNIPEVIREIKDKENGLEIIGTCLKEEEKEKIMLFTYVPDNNEVLDDSSYFDVNSIL